jgi:hypothetical protein
VRKFTAEIMKFLLVLVVVLVFAAETGMLGPTGSATGTHGTTAVSGGTR